MREVIMRLTPRPFEQAEYAEIVQELVRCKDCEYYTAEERWCRRLGLCGAFDPDGFCCWGERKEDE